MADEDTEHWIPKFDLGFVEFEDMYVTLFQIVEMVNPDGFLSEDKVVTSPLGGRRPHRGEESEDSHSDLNESQDSQVGNEDGYNDDGVENTPSHHYPNSPGLSDIDFDIPLLILSDNSGRAGVCRSSPSTGTC